MKNFYPNQYEFDSEYAINHNYLKKQFHDYSEIMKEVESVVLNSDFTLGKTVDEVKSALERDNFMTADAAKGFGLIDEVVEKRS